MGSLAIGNRRRWADHRGSPHIERWRREPMGGLVRGWCSPTIGACPAPVLTLWRAAGSLKTFQSRYLILKI